MPTSDGDSNRGVMDIESLQERAERYGRHLDSIAVATFTAIVILATGSTVALLALASDEGTSRDDPVTVHCDGWDRRAESGHCNQDDEPTDVTHCPIQAVDGVIFHCTIGGELVRVYHCDDWSVPIEHRHCTDNDVREFFRTVVTTASLLLIYSPLAMGLVFAVGAATSSTAVVCRPGFRKVKKKKKKKLKVLRKRLRERGLPPDLDVNEYCLKVAVWQNWYRKRLIGLAWLATGIATANFTTWALQDVMPDHWTSTIIVSDILKYVAFSVLLVFCVFVGVQGRRKGPRPRVRSMRKSGVIVDLGRPWPS